MSITVTGATASPSTIAPAGGQTTVTPALTDPDNTVDLTIQADGTKTTVAILVHEPEAFSVNPTDVGVAGKVVATLDPASALLATVVVGPAGNFIVTAK